MRNKIKASKYYKPAINALGINLTAKMKKWIVTYHAYDIWI